MRSKSRFSEADLPSGDDGSLSLSSVVGAGEAEKGAKEALKTETLKEKKNRIEREKIAAEKEGILGRISVFIDSFAGEDDVSDSSTEIDTGDTGTVDENLVPNIASFNAEDLRSDEAPPPAPSPEEWVEAEVTEILNTPPAQVSSPEDLPEEVWQAPEGTKAQKEEAFREHLLEVDGRERAQNSHDTSKYIDMTWGAVHGTMVISLPPWEPGSGKQPDAVAYSRIHHFIGKEGYAAVGLDKLSDYYLESNDVEYTWDESKETWVDEAGKRLLVWDGTEIEIVNGRALAEERRERDQRKDEDRKAAREEARHQDRKNDKDRRPQGAEESDGLLHTVGKVVGAASDAILSDDEDEVVVQAAPAPPAPPPPVAPPPLDEEPRQKG
jgi:hypothetical protein